jgi:rhodanese-related sulfurtransferase
MRLVRNIESIAPRAASDQFFTGRLVLVDVRSHHQYEQLRVPGAACQSARIPASTRGLLVIGGCLRKIWGRRAGRRA